MRTTGGKRWRKREEKRKGKTAAKEKKGASMMGMEKREGKAGDSEGGRRGERATNIQGRGRRKAEACKL